MDGHAFADACQAADRTTALQLLDIDHPGFGTREDVVDFLIERGHILHRWGEDDPAEWIRQHLWEADRRNTADAGATDLRGRSLADFDVTVPATGPVPRDNWGLPFNTPAQEDFLQACANAEPDRLRALLAADPTLIRSYTKWGMPALYQVGAQGSDDSAHNVESATLLLEAGATDAVQALSGACWWGGGDAVQAILAFGVPPHDLERDLVPLQSAGFATAFNEMLAPEHFLGIVEALLAAGADPTRPDHVGILPGDLANGPVAERLAGLGAERSRRWTLFSVKRMTNNREEMRAMIADDPDLLRQSDLLSYCTPILDARFAGDADWAAELASLKPYGPDLNEAAALGDLSAVRAALARLPARCTLGRTLGSERPGRPLHLAARFGHDAVCAELMDAGYSPATLSCPDVAEHSVGPEEVRDTTPLLIAAEFGHEAVLNRFLAAFDRHRGRA